MIMEKDDIRRAIEKAFEPYRNGEKTFIECQSDALVVVFGWPYEEIELPEK